MCVNLYVCRDIMYNEIDDFNDIWYSRFCFINCLNYGLNGCIVYYRVIYCILVSFL